MGIYVAKPKTNHQTSGVDQHNPCTSSVLSLDQHLATGMPLPLSLWLWRLKVLHRRPTRGIGTSHDCGDWPGACLGFVSHDNFKWLLVTLCRINHLRNWWLKTLMLYYVSQFCRLAGLSWVVLTWSHLGGCSQMLAGGAVTQKPLLSSMPKWPIHAVGDWCWGALGAHLVAINWKPTCRLSMWLEHLTTWQLVSQSEHSNS